MVTSAIRFNNNNTSLEKELLRPLGESDFVEVAKLDEVPAGKMKHMDINGKEIMIVNLDGVEIHPVMSLDNLKKGIPQAVVEVNSYRY